MQNSLRIIAGKWRGRRFQFPAIPGLRPTPDRVRETLFNWLAPVINGARCLDLFAGSGALGLEALSRGASEVYFYDSSALVVQQLLKTLKIFNETRGLVLQKSLPAQLPPQAEHAFDIVFLDPPFNQNLIAPCCQWLEENNTLNSGAYIYIECETTLKSLPLPANWQVLRNKKAGQVAYYLAQKF